MVVPDASVVDTVKTPDSVPHDQMSEQSLLWEEGTNTFSYIQGYSWLCAQVSLLVSSGDHLGSGD